MHQGYACVAFKRAFFRLRCAFRIGIAGFFLIFAPQSGVLSILAQAETATGNASSLYAYGEYLAAGCVTCHLESGEDNGIPAITGWQEDAFVAVMGDYRNKIRENQVMQMIASSLGNQEILALAAYFRRMSETERASAATSPDAGASP